MNQERATGYIKDYQDLIARKESPLASRSTNHPPPAMLFADAAADAMDIDGVDDYEPDGPLAKLQREAEKDLEFDLEAMELRRKSAGNEDDLFDGKTSSALSARFRVWRRQGRDVELEHAESENDVDDDDSDDDMVSRMCRGVDKTPIPHKDLEKMFPSIPGAGGKEKEKLVLDLPPPPTKPKVNRWKAHQMRQVGAVKPKKEKVEKKTAKAVSDMGLFDLLPGELRNYIYRLAFVPPSDQQPLRIEGSDLVCGNGVCVHQKAYGAAPAIASTCKQIRNELMPIYAAENEFHFNTIMVRNRCVAAFVKSLNTYARMLRKLTLEIAVYDRHALLGVEPWNTVEIVVTTPRGSNTGEFEVVFDPKIPKEKIEESGFVKLVERLNEDEIGVGSQASALRVLMVSDELSDLVWRCKK